MLTNECRKSKYAKVKLCKKNKYEDNYQYNVSMMAQRFRSVKSDLLA
jgi:hypothetical protein